MSSFLDSIKIGAKEGALTGFAIGGVLGTYTGSRIALTKNNCRSLPIVLCRMASLMDQILINSLIMTGSMAIGGAIAGGATHLIAPAKKNKEQFIETASKLVGIGMWLVAIGANQLYGKYWGETTLW